MPSRQLTSIKSSLPCRLAAYDLVITSYNTLAADFQVKAERKENGKGKQKQPLPVVNCPGDNRFPPLGAIKWHRCVATAAAGVVMLLSPMLCKGQHSCKALTTPACTVWF